MVAIIQSDKAGVGYSSGHLLELKTCKKGKYNDETQKQRKGLNAVSNKIFRGLIDQVDKQNYNEIYKVTEHIISVDLPFLII
jgi:hypothetical protein